MRTYRKLRCIRCLCLTGLLALGHTDVFGTYVPLESPLMETIDELRVRGVPLIRYPGVRNYHLRGISVKGEVTEWLDSRLSSPILNLEAWKDSIYGIRPTAFMCYEKNPVSIVLEPAVGISDGRIWPEKEFKGYFAADYERAFIDMHNKKFSLLFGRERFGFGHSSRHNLLLSGHSPPLDGVFASYEEANFKLSFIFSRLEDVMAETLSFVGDTVHSDTANSKRFISMRRLDLLAGDWGNIGITEVAIYGGPGGFPGLYYLNPVALSYPYEYIHDGANHNILWDIDWRLDFPGIAVYGEFLIDDFQYGKDPENEPNHVGLLIGSQMADPFRLKNVFIWLEYVKVTRWAYNHFIPWQRYEYLGFPIGHPYGSDFDNIFLKVTKHLTRGLDGYLKISRTRDGAEKIGSEWPVPECPRVSGTSFPDDNFLHSPVSTCLDMRIGANVFKTIGTLSCIVFCEAGVLKTEEYAPVIGLRASVGR